MKSKNKKVPENAMSDRGIQRSLRMMEGFGVHTFRFVNKTYKHCKTIAANGAGVKLIEISAAGAKMRSEGKTGEKIIDTGVLIDRNPNEFIKAIAQHRFREREKPGKVPA